MSEVSEEKSIGATISTEPQVTALPSEEPPIILYSVFSRCQRLSIIALVCITGLLSPLSSVLYTPALPKIADDLGVSISAINLTITSYLVFQGITPTLWGSIGDSLGRRMLYITTLSIYTGSCIGLAITNSYPAVLVLRALQATGSASAGALGAGVIGDLVHAKERGGFMGIYSAGAGLGTAFGPVLGGVFAQYTGWHGIFVFLLALSAAVLTIIVLMLPETLRAIVGNGSTPPPWYLFPPIPWLRPSPSFDSSIPLPPKRKVDISAPLRLMKEPDVLCSLVFTGVCFSVWQMSMVATSTLYAQEYGLNEASIGLTYISNGVGSLVGSLITGKILNFDYRRQLKREASGGPPGEDVIMIERARMLWLRVPVPLYIASVIAFGWSIQFRAHISVPIILHFFLGGLDTCILAAFSTLIVDLFEKQASSATASVNLARCLLSAAGVSSIQPMIKALGTGWSFTVLGGICILVSPITWIQLKNGPKWRMQRAAGGAH